MQSNVKLDKRAGIYKNDIKINYTSNYICGMKPDSYTFLQGVHMHKI